MTCQSTTRGSSNVQVISFTVMSGTNDWTEGTLFISRAAIKTNRFSGVDAVEIADPV